MADLPTSGIHSRPAPHVDLAQIQFVLRPIVKGTVGAPGSLHASGYSSPPRRPKPHAFLSPRHCSCGKIRLTFRGVPRLPGLSPLVQVHSRSPKTPTVRRPGFFFLLEPRFAMAAGSELLKSISLSSSFLQPASIAIALALRSPSLPDGFHSLSGFFFFELCNSAFARPEIFESLNSRQMIGLCWACACPAKLD